MIPITGFDGRGMWLRRVDGAVGSRTESMGLERVKERERSRWWRLLITQQTKLSVNGLVLKPFINRFSPNINQDFFCLYISLTGHINYKPNLKKLLLRDCP